MVEGAPLLRAYGGKTSIEGSNPSLSAKSICFIRVLAGFVNNYHIGYHKTLDVDLDRGIFS